MENPPFLLDAGIMGKKESPGSKFLEKKIKPDSNGIEEGEEHLAVLIKQAGDEARKRRKIVLAKHFQKLKELLNEAASHHPTSVQE